MADRGASEVISFALVFSLIVASVAVVSVSGVSSLQSARDAEQVNNAERAYDVFSANMADQYARGAPSRATEVSLGNAQLYTGENVTINVTAVDGGSAETVTRRLRPVVYSGNRDRQLVYEGGAVFRRNRDSGFVVEEPPFMLNDDRVYLPVIATQSGARESAGGSTVLLRTNRQSSELRVHDASETYDDVFVNVSSPRNDLWREYLDSTKLSCDPIRTINGEDYVECGLSDPDRVVVVVHEIGVTVEK